ncbi:uncharacterized protein KY384_004635 [Bacidia gigantensis]|uniref:uncharacterized protein n=1 Tax=Bacidia gigantensis TaxID=2732470 RepID=UPI001D03F776|nr:uncharacterized protein KY384_004635 [Bacidia gigantensis]KAG8530597.1 hypothetical protein KY384_004635 [Bacidia gigantensis]
MDGSGCCSSDEPWARCFLRLARGTNDQDCTVINNQKCGSDIELDPGLNETTNHQVRYIQKNIHEINNFFSNYFHAIDSSKSTTSLDVGSLTSTLNPIKSTPAPELAAGTLAIRSLALRVLIQSFLVSATHSPSLIKSFLPLGSAASQVEQIGDLSSMLESITTDLKDGFDRLLKVLMGDVAQFTLFASTGAWSGQISADYAQSIKGYDFMLKTHISSQALKMNDYWGQALAEVDQEWWDTSGQSGRLTRVYDEHIEGDHDHKSPPDGQLNGNWFRSNATRRVYALNWKRGEKPENGQDAGDILKMFKAYGWAQMEVLFDGAVNCTYSGRAGSDQVIGINPDGGLNVECISSLPIYFYCNWTDLRSCCPAYQYDGTCPYFGHVGGCKWFGLGSVGVEWMWN